MKELSAFQRDLLFVIDGMDEPYGLGIKADLEAYRETTINPGQLYPNLNALVEKGYLTKQQKDDRTNLYVPTDRVARAIADRRAWEDEQCSETERPTPSP
ncbi:PadR family transcriptional regulator [Halonotius sp. F2-221B]|jgi:DNA-binding PadR family transcriptional regulator|uniref:helix-turn-helix transcriptional regulator n=1 Tax=Halonotius sp. F2-221B TaxID=2731620 RepID=UPI00398B42A4